MARRKKKRRRTACSDSAANTGEPRQTPVAATTGEATRPASRGRLVIAVCVFVVWGMALVSLAMLTANPATLNRAQIEQADVIITGRIVDTQQGTVAVEQTWNSRIERMEQTARKQITVRNLAETNARNGSSFLLPLSQMASGVYAITQPQLPGQRDKRSAANVQRRIYPATGDVLTQLQEILKR